MTLRQFIRCAITMVILASSGSVLAQDLKDRELRPAFDFTKIQMPVEIVSIKLNGTEVQPGEKISGDDDWLRGLSFTLKNISDKPLGYIAMGLRFPQPNGFVVFNLSYGVDFSRGEPRRSYSPPAIQPGETVDLILTKQRYPNFLEILSMANAARSFEVAPYYVERISFADDPDVIWEGGYLKRRDASTIGKFDIIERYVLPAKKVGPAT